MKLYLITLNKPTLDEKLNHVITVLGKKKYISTYLYRYITVLHLDHFNKWCENKNLDPSLMATTVEYVNTCWYEELDDYAVVVRKLNKNELLSVFRSLLVCVPVGGEWEYETELDAYVSANEQVPNETNENKNLESE